MEQYANTTKNITKESGELNSEKAREIELERKISEEKQK
jgi:hypothetical protein